MYKNSVNKVIMAVGAILAVMTAGCGSAGRWREAHGSVWNTLYNVTYMADSDLSDSIIATLHDVEMSVSAFAPGSVIRRINDNATDTVDETLRYLFDMSQTICKESGGAFDPTLAPLVNLWGFGYEATDGIPTQAQIDSALGQVGILDCHVADDGVMCKKSAGTQFNFSAIAKGYGCDVIGSMLERNGCEDYMVEIGGEIALKGNNARGEAWRIMIDAPVACDTAVTHERMAVVSVTDCGIATSGDYRNFRNDGSKRVAHTISPATGYPISMAEADTVTLSATVIAPTAAEADGLATACMLMACDDAMTMVESKSGRSVMLVVKMKGTDNYNIFRSPSFPELRR